jgi:drug/metabolite transporter (DMT)-like permease
MSIAITYPAPAKTQSAAPLLIIAFGGALTGFSGILVRISEIDPIATGAWRLLIAALALWPFMRMAGNTGAVRLRLGGWAVLVLAGLFFAIDTGLYNWSLKLTSIAHATLIVNLAPMVALAAGFLMFGERFGPAKAFALIAALSGAALMTVTRSDGGGTLIGNSLAFLAMIGYALYLVAVKQARHEHDTLAIMVWSSLVGAVAMFAAAALAGEQLLPSTTYGWGVLITLGLLAHVFGQGLVAFGMREAPVGLASILLLTQPLVATIAAWVIFGEAMGPIEAAGAGLVLAGLVIASLARR